MTSCKKLIEVGTPLNQLTTDKVFADTSSATAAIAGAYAIFNVSIDPSYNKFLGLYTDCLIQTARRISYNSIKVKFPLPIKLISQRGQTSIQLYIVVMIS